MRARIVITATLSIGCARSHGDARQPDAKAECLADFLEDATVDALTVLGADDRETLGAASDGPLRTNPEAPPLDLDGDGQPEIDVVFPAQFGAYSRVHWLYATTDDCTRLLGRFEEAYSWPGTERHAGMLDLLVLLGADAAADGGGTMTRLVFDGERYVPDGSLECPKIAGDDPRDSRCPGQWGQRGAWIETGGWNDGAKPVSSYACVNPAGDASMRFEGARLSENKLADIDGDGEPDLAYGAPDLAGNAGEELEVYVSGGGCPRNVGRITGLSELAWDATKGELEGGWVETPVGSCEQGDVGTVLVFYRLDATGLVESRRISCPCEGGPPECR